MKRVWSANFEHQEVLRLFLRSNPLPKFNISVDFSDKPWDKIPPGQCAIFWAKANNFSLSGPMILVAEKRTLDVTLPKLMAFPGKLSPVTAFCRIWDKNAATEFADRTPPRLDETAIGGFIGLMIAELLTRHGAEIDMRRLGIGLVSRLFSHSCAQLLFAGGRESELNRLGVAWLEAALFTRNEVDKRLVSTLTFLNSFLLSEILEKPSFDGSPTRLGAAIDAFSNQSTDLFSSEFKSKMFSNFANEVKSMARELRLANIENLIIDLRKKRESDNQHLIDLQCGFLLSLIDPTSLAFIDMAVNIDGRQGYVASSYAMCTGLLGGSNFLWMGEGFGVNILSSLVYEKDTLLNSHPDISLDELRFLRNPIGESGFEFRTAHPSAVQVELLPDVTGSFPNGARKEPVGSKSHSLLIAKLENIDDLTLMLKKTLDEIRTDIGLPLTTRITTRKKREKNNE